MLSTVYSVLQQMLGFYGGTLVFLTVLASRYITVMKQAGIYLDTALLIVTNDQNSGEALLSLLKGDPGNPVIVSSLDHERFRERFSLNRDDIIHITYQRRSSNSEVNLHYVNDLILDQTIDALPIVEFREAIPAPYSEMGIPINISVNWDVLQTYKNDLISFSSVITSFGEQYYQKIIDCFNQGKGIVRLSEYSWLYAGIILTDLMASVTGDSPEFVTMIQKDLVNAINHTEDACENAGLSEAFIRAFHSYMTETGLRPVNRFQIQNPDEAFCLCDKTYYYLSEELFCRICDPLKAVASSSQINTALAMDGIQEFSMSRGRNYFTTKVTLLLPGKAVKRMRYHKVKRDYVDALMTEMLADGNKVLKGSDA